MKALKPKWAVVTLGVLAVGVGAARYARPGHANQTDDASQKIQPELVGSPALDSVLVRACGDCHSNRMSARWYTRVPPFSSMIARGSREGRKAVNFATWSAYSPEQQRALLGASCTDAKTGKMPMGAYLRFRPDAKLSADDVEKICGAVR